MIRNERTGDVLVTRHRIVTNLFAQAVGLMLRAPLRDEGWIFTMHRPGRWDITNLFVFQTIDVLWLDADHKVLQKRSVAPFTPRVRGATGTVAFIELPKGAADDVHVGDRITWE